MKSHKDLEVWQLAVELAVAVYAATRTFPKDEWKMLHGLIRSVGARHADSKASERP